MSFRAFKLISLVRMVDRDQTNIQLETKIHLGGPQGVPRGLLWGDFMARQLKSLKILIFRAFKLISLVRMVDRDQTNIQLETKIHLGGPQGVPRGLLWGDFMARQLKSLKILIFRAFKLISLVKNCEQAPSK